VIETERILRNLVTIVTLTACWLLVTSPFNCASQSQSFALDQKKPLSKTVVLNVLSRFKKAAIPERKLVETVKEDGVDFRLTPEIELELKQARASKTLIEAISQNCRGLQCIPEHLLQFDFKTVTLVPDGNEISSRNLRAECFTENLNGIPLEMVKIPGDAFLMGSPESEDKREGNEGPQHSVTVQEFFMGRFEVTLGQWRQVERMPKVKIDLNKNPTYYKHSMKHPMEGVSWEEAVEFCKRLEKRTGRPYRLPTEAEWEYAARAGTSTPFAFGPTITPTYVNCSGYFPYGSAPMSKGRGEMIEVGSLNIANAFGLSDMHGNLWEWCEDDFFIFDDNYIGAPGDGSARSGRRNSVYRVMRGGSFRCSANDCRSASRSGSPPGVKREDLGFRVVFGARTN
jgi:formylglycine-generating enzyme required for sulfatase activity